MIRIVRSCVAAALTVAVMGIFGGSALAQDSKSGRIFCWKDKSGKVVGCGDKVPLEYQDSATREMDRRGVTRATTESAEDAARRRAQEKETSKQKAEEHKRLAEQKRQDAALLNTFSNDKEIDQKRDRDLQQLDSQLTQLQVSLRNATERYNDAKTRSDTSKDKKLAEALKEDVVKTVSERQRLEQQIAAKEKEKDEIRQRYADQKKRYLELRGEVPAAAVPAVSPSTQKAADQGKADKSQPSPKAANTTKEQFSDAIREKGPKGPTRDSDPSASK
jgi:chromosome segregation ATPase